MTDLSSIISSINTGVNKGTNSAQTLSADMDTFLTLLTTQLQYQDPLDPMDASEYTNQLVQYSNVEQAIQTNSKLDNLLNLSIYNLGVQATGYVGKTIQAISDVMPLDKGAAKATYTLSKDVIDCTIVLKDMDDKVVYTAKGETSSGAHDLLWDGKNINGEQLPDGAYKIEVLTTVPEGETSASVTTTVFGRVTGVASDDSGIYLGLGDALTTTLDYVVTSRNEDYWDKLIAEIQKNNGASSEDEDLKEELEQIIAQMA